MTTVVAWAAWTTDPAGGSSPGRSWPGRSWPSMGQTTLPVDLSIKKTPQRCGVFLDALGSKAATMANRHRQSLRCQTVPSCRGNALTPVPRSRHFPRHLRNPGPTARPDARAELLAPRQVMMHVSPIKQRDQHIDIAQGPHHSPTQSRSRSINASVTSTPRSGSGSKP